ncbi:MAG: hypothetical protein AAF193_02535, partial [Bacteroidota bacterium]
ISAVAGDDDGAGNVDFNSGAISVSPGTPITFFEVPSVDISGGGAICFGDTADVVFDYGGTGPWTVLYQIDGSPGTGFPVITTADPFILETDIAGEYTILNVTNNVCDGTVTGSAEVIVNDLPTGTLTQDGSFCEGGSYDLEITLTGQPNWDVTITHDDGNGVITDEVINVAASPAVYTVTDSLTYFITSITDGNTCTNDVDSDIVTVTIDPLPTASFAFGDSIFCDGASVDVIVNLTGTGPWTLDYTNVDGVQQEVVAATPFIMTVTQDDVISLDQVQDNLGCVNVLNESIMLNVQPLPVVDAGPDVAVCDQEEFFIGTAGNPAYTYQWTPNTWLDDDTQAVGTGIANSGFNVDISQEYIITATEGFCSLSDTVVLTVRALPNANAGDDLLICYGDDVQLNATGGDTYLWEPNPWMDPTQQATADPLITPLADVELVVEVTDQFLCATTDTINIGVPAEFLVVETATNEVCFGICDGAITLEPSGSWAPILVDWTQLNADSLNPANLCAGTYDYTLVDSIGCTLTGSITIDERPEYFLDDVLITQPICFGDETGIIEVQSATAVQFDVLDPVLTNNGGLFIGLPAGMYDVQAVDAAGCIADSTVTYAELSSEMSISVPQDSIIICVGEEVPFSASANGGDGNITYNWYNESVPGGFESNDNPYNVVLPDEVTYFVNAIDGLGCSTDTLSIVAVFDTPIEVVAGPQDVIEICQGECVNLTANASGGNGILSLEWFSDDGTGPISQTTLPNYSDCPLEATEYVVFADDGCSQTASDTILVTVLLTPVVQVSADVYSGCFPLEVTLFNNTDPNLSNACIWDLQDGNIQPVCSDIQYTFTSPGTYIPELTVTSINGCTGSGVIDIPIEVYDYPIADFTWTPDPVTILENEVQLINQSVNASTFNWDLSSGDQFVNE